MATKATSLTDTALADSKLKNGKLATNGKPNGAN